MKLKSGRARYDTKNQTKGFRVMELIIIFGILGLILTGDLFKMGGR